MRFEIHKKAFIEGDIYYICVFLTLDDEEYFKEVETDDYVDDIPIHQIHLENPKALINKIVSELDPNEYIIHNEIKYLENLDYSKKNIIVNPIKIFYDISNINHNCFFECFIHYDIEYYNRRFIFFDNSNKYLNDFLINDIFYSVSFKNINFKLFKYNYDYDNDKRPILKFTNCKFNKLIINRNINLIIK